MATRKTKQRRVASRGSRHRRTARRRRERAGAKTPGAPSKHFRGWVRGKTIPGTAGPAFGTSGLHGIQPLSLFDPGSGMQRLEAREVASDARVAAAPPAVRVVRSPKVYPARNAYKHYGMEADVLAEALNTLKLGKKQTSGSKAKKKGKKKPASRKSKGKGKQYGDPMNMDAMSLALASLEDKSRGTK